MEGEGEGFFLGGQWKVKEKVLSLVANGRWRRRFFPWWPMEGEGEVSFLGGQWKVKEKVLSLVANGRWRRRFFPWWPMEGEGEGFFFGGQWKVKEKVFCLVANGKWRRRFSAWWLMEGEGKNYLLLFPLSPQPILLKPSIFPLDLKVLLYRGSRLLFVHPPPFSLAYKSRLRTLMSQVPPTFTTNLILLKIFLFSLEIMASRMVTSYGP